MSAQLLDQLTPESAKALRTAQEAWAHNMKMKAAFVLVQEGDGSRGHLVVANKEKQPTRIRINELRQWSPQKQ